MIKDAQTMQLARGCLKAHKDAEQKRQSGAAHCVLYAVADKLRAVALPCRSRWVPQEFNIYYGYPSSRM